MRKYLFKDTFFNENSNNSLNWPFILPETTVLAHCTANFPVTGGLALDVFARTKFY